MFRCKLIFSAFLAGGLVWASAQEKGERDPAFGEIDSIVKSLAQITGLQQKHAVPYGRMNKHQLHQFLNKRIKKTLRPEDIKADELSLKMFGLVPQDFDLKKSTIDLLTEQAAAFYDYDDKKLFLLEGASFNEETTTLAHELAHALADQYFNLQSFMDETPSNDDENLARTAVVEGEASWLMLAYELKRNGQKPEPTTEMLRAVADSGDSSMADFPVLKSSPLYIQQSLLFPYAQGILFFEAVHKRMGQAAFRAVFTDPPSDSAQVIHPEKYFAHEKATEPKLPKAPGPDGKEVTTGSMGEFDHQMLLQQYLGAERAAKLAPHLRGGLFRITTRDKKEGPVLQYAAEWDSQANANAYFEAYQRVLRAKWKRCEASVNKAGVFAGSGDNGFFVVTLSGVTVTSVEGIAGEDELRQMVNAAN